MESDHIRNCYCKEESLTSPGQKFELYSNEIPFEMASSKKTEYNTGNSPKSEKIYSGKRKGEESRVAKCEKKRIKYARGNSDCGQCRISFRYDKDYVKHCKDRHGNDKPFACPNCPKTFVFKNTRAKHFKRKHGPCDSIKLPCRRYRGTVSCETCDVTFQGWRFFEKHALEKHEGVKMMPCSRCPKKFFRRTSVLKHEQMKHSAEFKCVHCGNIFDRTDELKEHEGLCVERQLKKRTGDKAPDVMVANMEHVRIRCDECGGEFESFNALKNHYKSGHPEIKLFPCDYCSRAFRQKFTLEKHVDMRHPEKRFDLKLTEKYRRGRRYACEYCESEIVGITEYVNHGSREHPGLPMFSCRDCGKGFSRKDSLTVHANEAHGQFKKQCSYCTKRFYRRCYLLGHEEGCKRSMEKRELLRKDADISRYHCDICAEDVFGTNTKFVSRHLKWHRESDVCAICNSGFNRVKNPSGLAKHMQARHPHIVAGGTDVLRNSSKEGGIL